MILPHLWFKKYSSRRKIYHYNLLQKKKNLYHIGCICVVFAIYNPSLMYQQIKLN